MGDRVLKKISEYIRAHKLERKWQMTLTSLGAVVVFCTTYALILPALTLEKDKLATASDADEKATAGDADYDPEADIELINDLEVEEEELATDSDWYAPDIDLFNDLASDSNASGRWAQNLLTMAESQVGYTEGSDGYSYYGEYFGKPYEKWNTLFLNFCLDYVQIPKKVIPQEDTAAALASALKKSDQALYMTADDYTPKPGDLVFLDTDEDGRIDRVGVVSTCEDGTLVVIEGDAAYDSYETATASDAEEAEPEDEAAAGTETATASNAES